VVVLVLLVVVWGGRRKGRTVEDGRGQGRTDVEGGCLQAPKASAYQWVGIARASDTKSDQRAARMRDATSAVSTPGASAPPAC
jgi:hypothetical protein